MNTTLAGMPAVVTPPDLELIDEVLDMSELDGKTTKKYKQHLLEFRAYLDEKAAGKPLSAVEKNDVKRFLADLMHGKRYGMTGDGKPRQGELSPSTRKSVVSALRALYVHCIDLYGLPLDPCYRITVKQPKPKRGLTISEADVKRILDAPGRERDRVQAHLKFYTAARTISLRNLLWSDVDFERNVIHFDAKFNDAYTVHMHPQLKAALLRWRDAVEKQAERRQAVRVALTDPDTVYAGVEDAALFQVARGAGRRPPPPRPEQGRQGELEPHPPARLPEDGGDLAPGEGRRPGRRRRPLAPQGHQHDP